MLDRYSKEVKPGDTVLFQIWIPEVGVELAEAKVDSIVVVNEIPHARFAEHSFSVRGCFLVKKEISHEQKFSEG